MQATKRTAIQDAALKLFAEKGVKGTTTREIANLAGTSEGNIYRHFESKDDLSRHIFDRCARQFHETLVRSSKAGDDPLGRLKGLVQGIFSFADECPDSFAYLMMAPQTSLIRTRHQDQRPLPMQLFIQTLEEGIEDGVIRAVDPGLATGWIVSMGQRAVVFSRSELLRMNREQIVQETVDAVMRMLNPRPV
jgi:AcrR family transcriptional regulator